MPNAVTYQAEPNADAMALATRQLVSVVVPCRNEGEYIEPCLDSIVAQTWPKQSLEVLIVDGMSDDGTRATVAQFAARYPWIRLIDNPRRTTPAALNVGIRSAAGEIVCRMDAHCRYPNDYLAVLIANLDAHAADNTGGVCRTLPASDRPMPRAIALALAHQLAVGNAHFRVGAAAPRLVDTVPFGCYRRSVFDRIGLFDEELVRNQDDEFNHRLLKHGGRILLVPSVVIEYYGRSSIAKLARMMFQYGFFKPLAARKLGRVATVRQLVPPLFVACLVASLLLAPWWTVARFALLAIVASYSAVVLLAAARELPKEGIAVAALLSIVIPVIHFSYGGGFLQGLWSHVIRGRSRRQQSAPAEVQLTR